MKRGHDDPAAGRTHGLSISSTNVWSERSTGVGIGVAGHLGRTLRRLVSRRPVTGKLIWAALRTDEANLTDLIRFGRGNRFSLDHPWEEFRAFDIDERLTRFDAPIVFMLGRHDWQVPAVLAARYFDRIQAPAKRLIWFEGSAHTPPFEEPEHFNRVVVETLRLVTGATGMPAPVGAVR